MVIQTSFDFELPIGFQDAQGNLHKHGQMRLATAMDEISVLGDARVRANDAYIVIALLSRVIPTLGDLPFVNESIIENLFAGDLSYLQEFYRQINENGASIRQYVCPHCAETIEVDLAASGGE